MIETMSINNAKLIESFSQGKKVTILTKPKIPPIFGRVNYERYEEQILHWDQDSKDSELNKFNHLLNELNRKKEFPGSVMNIVHDRTHREGNKENIRSSERKVCKYFGRENKGNDREDDKIGEYER